MLRFNDPLCLPGTRIDPATLLGRAVDLAGTPGQTYVERRCVPLAVATTAGVRYAEDYAGRPAVLVGVWDPLERLTSVHGRYLHATSTQNKMLTVGSGGGALGVLGGWRVDPLILVEGLFDALSLATCGFACIATIGRWAPWLPEVSAGRVVWLAFDATRPGEADVVRFSQRLPEASVCRLPPPPRCKDWSTALVKLGGSAVTRWLRGRLTTCGTTTS